MIVLPADHVVKDKGHFLNVLEDAVMFATEGTHLVTLVGNHAGSTGY